MEMHQLRYFVAVAEELHFGRAAKRENVSQPPLSLQIKKLESELGVVLFERTKRSVKLTEAGYAFLPTARSILTATLEGKRAAQKAHRGESGTITIGFVHSASISYLPTLIGPFRRQFPDIRIEFKEMTVSDQMKALNAGVIDVGILRAPTPDERVESFIVQREDFCVAVNITHRLAQKHSLTVADLKEEGFVFYPEHRSPAFFHQLINLCAQAGFVPRVNVEANTMYTAVGLVGTDAGIAILPNSISVVQAPLVKYLPLKTPGAYAELYLSYRSDNHSKASQTLIDFAKTVSTLTG